MDLFYKFSFLTATIIKFASLIKRAVLVAVAAGAAVAGTAFGQTYKIGDKHPDGGLVATVDASGSKGIIVEEKDSGPFTPPEAIAAGKAKGAGWGLPNIKDLRLVYSNLHEQGKGDFQPKLYQAADASSAQYRKGLHFNDGKEETGIAQNNKVLVRFVRAFSSKAPAAPAPSPSVADAQEIKVGSVIQLRNKAVRDGGDRYLEVQGNAKDLPAFGTDQFANAKFVFANSSKDRDKVSGSWKVLSAEKKEGDPIAYGDKIRLQSLTPGGAYLADVNHVMREEFGEAFKAKGLGNMDAFFAFAQQTSEVFATDWFVGSGDADTMANIQKGAKVKAGDAIMLESLGHGRGNDSAFRNASLSLYLLQAPFSTAQVPMFKNYKDRDLVFSSRYDSRGAYPQDMCWIVNLASSASSLAAPALQRDGFPLRGAVTLAQGRKYFSESGKHYLVFQPDGNLVVYTAANQFVWGLNTITPKFSEAKIAEFQAEGNLAVSGANRAYIWSALTGRRAPDTSAYLTLTSEGVLRLVSGNSGAAMWSSR